MSKGTKGETNIKLKEWGGTVRERRAEKNWDEINIKPKTWGETVRERRKERN